MANLKVTDECIGCSACVSNSPNLFEMDDAKAVPKKTELTDADIEEANQNVSLCPVDAIKIE